MNCTLTKRLLWLLVRHCWKCVLLEEEWECSFCVMHVAAPQWQNRHLSNSVRGGGRGAAQKKYTRIPPSTARSSSLLSSWLMSTDQRDIAKVDKFKSLFAGSNLSLGEFCLLQFYLRVIVIQLYPWFNDVNFQKMFPQYEKHFLGNLPVFWSMCHSLVHVCIDWERQLLKMQLMRGHWNWLGFIQIMESRSNSCN